MTEIILAGRAARISALSRFRPHPFLCRVTLSERFGHSHCYWLKVARRPDLLRVWLCEHLPASCYLGKRNLCVRSSYQHDGVVSFDQQTGGALTIAEKPAKRQHGIRAACPEEVALGMGWLQPQDGLRRECLLGKTVYSAGHRQRLEEYAA